MIPAKPNVFGLGLRYDTEEGAALLLNIGLGEKMTDLQCFNRVEFVKSLLGSLK